MIYSSVLRDFARTSLLASPLVGTGDRPGNLHELPSVETKALMIGGR